MLKMLWRLLAVALCVAIFPASMSANDKPQTGATASAILNSGDMGSAPLICTKKVPQIAPTSRSRPATASALPTPLYIPATPAALAALIMATDPFVA